MKAERGLVLASAAAILVIAALAGSVLALKQAQIATHELASMRDTIIEQLRVSKRVQAQFSTRLAKTDAAVYGLTQAFTEFERDGEARSSAHGSGEEAPPTVTVTPPEAETEAAELVRQAIADAETLVATATQTGRWTEQDRDRLHELLVEVDGRERQRIESGVGKLLVEGRLVIEGDFVPL